MDKLLLNYCELVVVSSKNYNAILGQLLAYKLYPRIMLNSQNIDSDKSPAQQNGFALIGRDLGVFIDGD
jgi:hypothetical protein